MKIKAKEVFLLVSPVLLLISIGIVFRQPKPPLVLERANVVTVPENSRKFFYAPGIHTKAVLLVRYNGPSLYKHFVTGLHPYEISGNGYLVDEKGHKYKSFPISGDAMMNGTRPVFEGYVRRQKYAISFPVPLTHVPRSAGRVTLKGKVIVNHKWSLPVSVVVRNQ